MVILDNCEHVVDAAAALAVRLLDAAPGLRILCTSQVPLDVDGEAVFELAPLALSDAVELFTRRASAQRTTRASSQADDAVHELCRSLDGLPLAIELAAARTKTLSIEEITRRLDDRFSVLSDPTSRRPERRRALKSTIRWSYDLLFPDDQRGLWALATFAGGAPLPAVESVLEALDVPAAAAIDVVGRLASRSLVIVDDDDAPMTVRYRLLDSIRAFALEAMADAGLTERALRRARRLVRRRRRILHAGCAQQPPGRAPRLRPGRARQHRRRAGLERRARPAARARASSTGSAGPGSSSATAEARNGSWPRSTPPATRPPARDRANALLLAAWIEASTGHLELARDHIAAATDLADAIDDVDLQARCCYYLAYVVSHHGEFGQALELTDRSRRPLRRAGPAVGPGRERALRRPGRDLGRRRGAQRRGCRPGPALAADASTTRGCTFARDAMLGELARIQHRFDDAVVHLGRAAETSRRLGFLQTEAYQLSSLGRAQCQAGDYDAGAATLELAIDKAEATGDVRLAALARVHLGRVLRALGQVAEARDGARGGGCVAPRRRRRRAGRARRVPAGRDGRGGRVPGRRGTSRRDPRRGPTRTTTPTSRSSPSTRSPASPPKRATSPRHSDLCETADRRMEAASHFITELDRTDAHRSGRSPERLSSVVAQSTTGVPGPSLAIGGTTSSFVRRCSPRWLITMKASSPPITMAMPTTCPPRSVSPSSRNDHTTARAG